jgi:MFS family permease
VINPKVTDPHTNLSGTLASRVGASISRGNLATMQGSAPVGGGVTFWSGRVASSLANVITSVTIPYFLAISQNLPPATVGLILSIQSLGFIAAPFISGYLVDTRERLWTMRCAEFLRAAALAAMAVAAFTETSVEAVFVICSFTASLAGSIYYAALSASVPDIAGDEMLPRMNARLQGINTATESLGGIAGSAILNFFGVPLALALNALLFALSSLGFTRSDWGATPEKTHEGRSGYLQTIREGFRLLVENNEFRCLIVTGSMANFVIAGSTLPILILFVDDLQYPFYMYTVVLGIGSAGALLGAAQFSRISEFIGSAKRAQVLALAVYAIGFAIYATLGRFGVVSFILAAFTDAIIGVAISVYVIHNATQQQRVIPREMRGRSSSLRAFANSGMSAIGVSMTGALVGLISAVWTVWISACAMLAVAALALLALPRPQKISDDTDRSSDPKREKEVK